MHTKKRILVVDDEPLIRELIAAIISKLLGEGYDVLLCPSAEAGVDEIMDIHFDLIITDYDCSPGNGGDVIEAARRFQPKVPIILISGGRHVGVDYESLGADTFLAKPFSIDKLIESAHVLLNQEPAPQA